MLTFKEVLASLEPDDGVYRTEAPEGWGQGRTLYGGMTAALMTEVARLAGPDLAPLRSGLFTFIGPASGLLSIRPRLVRQGKSATVISVEMAAGEAPCAQAFLTFGAPRASSLVHDITRAPACTSPQDSEAFIPPGAPRPEFHQHFDLRKAGGLRPFEGGARAEYLVWGRHLEGGESVSEPGLVALADALPPAALGLATERGAISTMTWMIDIVRQAQAEDWRLLRSLSESASDGYSQQAMEVYDADGRRLAVGRQTVALFM